MGIFTWLSVAHLALIAAIYIITAVYDFKLCKMLEYLGIVLHISATFMLLLAGAELEVLLLTYTSSLLLYLTSRVLSDRVKGGRS